MKTTSLFVAVLLIASTLLCGCGMGFGTTYIEDPALYGQHWDDYLDAPAYLPASVEPYSVNRYAYTLYAYMDICYEIFLDLTVTKEQLAELIAHAKSSGSCYEQAAYYANGYIELVFSDEYALHPHPDTDDVPRVWQANVKKVVYNPDTCNMIFVDLYCFDSGVYALEDVEYFSRFGIRETEYASHI